MRKIFMLTMVVVLAMIVSSAAFADGGVEKRKGYVVSIGHLGEGLGYVNVSVDKDMDEDGYSQITFRPGDSWQNELEIGDEVFYLAFQKRIIKVFPTAESKNPTYEKGGAVEKHKGYVVRIGHINGIGGYVNVSVDKDMNEDGYSQIKFRPEDSWQNELEIGDEVFYLAFQKRIIKVFEE